MTRETTYLYLLGIAVFMVILGVPVAGAPALVLAVALFVQGWRSSPKGEPSERYAAPAARWGEHEYVVFDSIAPEARYYFDQGPLGEHCRWMIGQRQKWEWKDWPTWRQIFTGNAFAWRPVNMTFVRVTWWQQALAWVFALYCVGSILTRARRG